MFLLPILPRIPQIQPNSALLKEHLYFFFFLVGGWAVFPLVRNNTLNSPMLEINQFEFLSILSILILIKKQSHHTHSFILLVSSYAKDISPERQITPYLFPISHCTHNHTDTHTHPT